MNVIILAAAIIGGSATRDRAALEGAALAMRDHGAGAAVTSAGGETPLQRPVVSVYAPSWCSGCPAKTTRLERECPEFNFVVNDNSRSFPRWVEDVLGEYPVLYWRFPDGREFQISDYATPEDFRARYERTRRLAATRDDQAPTPLGEVRRVLSILRPQSGETFVDYGCGDGRWLIEAARTYGCRAVGVEIDPQKAAEARRNVQEAGLTGRVEIIEGDATTADVTADVGVAYLYPDLLQKLRPRLLRLKRFATYMHRVEGVAMQQNGDSWVWTRPAPVVYSTAPAVAWYGGQAYSGRVCSNPRCSMCAAIARQLGR